MEKYEDLWTVDETPKSPSSHGDDGLFAPCVPEKYRGTVADRHDMQVLGREQVLRRNFKSITIMGFASMVMVAWEALLVIVQYPLLDGGPPCIFWGLIIAPIGLTFVYASIAELASMSPTAGGQYHFVSEYAPPKYQKVLSYITGWLIALGWQTWLAGTSFMAATAIQGLISLNMPSYTWDGWRGTLLVIGIVVFSVLFNTVLAARLPFIEGILLILHVAGLFAIIIPLWVMAPIGNPRTVLLEFEDNGDWGNTGLSTMIGLPGMIAMLYGYDCVVHMSEEVKDASKVIPPAILGGMWTNAVLMLVVGVTFIFTMGDTEAILESPIGVPFIQSYLNATGSYAATNIVTVFIIVMLISACVSEVATASRQIWSFARDDGLPFSSWLAKVAPGWNVPVNAVLVSIGFTALISLINIGSTVAMNAVNSLAQVAILGSYIITISCLIWRRLYGEPLPPSRWSLGRWGLPINIISLLFMLPVISFATWPLEQPVTPQNMNWSSVMFVGVLALAAIFYVVKARHVYVGPVVLIKRD
ncbi:hypothetical protein PRZ48_010321 [Zasmidium cellare]|uniref:Amino acid transporter n=1 Tax=Zasmidium cellare TaxID=395010 RepID=A0ABR0E988_ZASCE|nr:hypothetical protein PRZ48_010321 [Zasmidium cellare]